MKKLLATFGVLVTLTSAASASTMLPPSVNVTLNGLLTTIQGSTQVIGNGIYAMEYAGEGFRLWAKMDSDPSLVWGLAVTNSAAGPVVYGFDFSTPVDPGTYNYIVSSMSASATDGANDGVIATPVNPPFAKQANPYTNLGLVPPAAIGDDCIDAPGGQLSTSCTYPDVTYNFPDNAGISTLGVGVIFSLTGGRDTYTANGRVDLLQKVVPEPKSMLLLGAGLLALAAVSRRRSA